MERNLFDVILVMIGYIITVFKNNNLAYFVRFFTKFDTTLDFFDKFALRKITKIKRLVII